MTTARPRARRSRAVVPISKGMHAQDAPHTGCLPRGSAPEHWSQFVPEPARSPPAPDEPPCRSASPRCRNNADAWIRPSTEDAKRCGPWEHSAVDVSVFAGVSARTRKMGELVGAQNQTLMAGPAMAIE